MKDSEHSPSPVSEEIVESMVRAFMDTADFVVGDGEMEAHNLHVAMRAALATLPAPVSPPASPVKDNHDDR